MYDTLPASSYVSRVIPVSPGVAREAFGSARGVRAARLRCSAMRSLPIEIELQPWSATRSELGLRFPGRRRPTTGDLEKAGVLLEAVAAEVELRCLLATHPSHGVGEERVVRPERRAVASAWL